jgi:para-nitrobenzyl esterase
MRRFALSVFLSVPLLLAACGDTPEEPTGPSSTSTSTGETGGSATGGTATGGSAAGGGGMGGSATGGSATGGAGGSEPSPYYTDLTLPAPSASPVNLGAVEADFHADVEYGSDPMHRFDIFLPKSATPTPLMIHIHGGGFVGGDKAIMSSPKLIQTLSQGVAYASLNYRLLQDVDTEGVIKPLSDCARALQFLRYHAAELNIDPTKVVVKGGSAGAGTSLWIGLHDDMAAAGGSDPVAKMSTRVLGIGANATQGTYDLVKWETVVFAELGISLAEMVAALGSEQRLASFYGMASAADIDTPAIQAYRAEVDMFAHMSADDPPIFVHNQLMTSSAPANQNELFHHPYHAKSVKEMGEAAGIEVVAVMEALGVDESNGQDDWDFLLDKLLN